MSIGTCTRIPDSEADAGAQNEYSCSVMVTPASSASTIKSNAASVAGVYSAAYATPSSPPSDDGGSAPIGIIVGVVIGVVVVGGIIIGLVIFKKRSSSRGGRNYEDSDNYTPLHLPGREGGDMNIRMDEV